MSVLILEHHAMMRRLLADVLKHLGIGRVSATSSVDEAWEMFSRDDYDLLLVDWGPDVDGRGFVRRVRSQDSANPFAHVIMVTAYAEQHRVHMARDAGMHEYLRKPVSAKLIYTRICSLIENDRLFIKTGDFFGPNRRRRMAAFRGAERRAAFIVPFPDRRGEPRDIAHDERRQGLVGYVGDRRRIERPEAADEIIDLSCLSDAFPVNDPHMEEMRA